jgi:hypothetical protein
MQILDGIVDLSSVFNFTSRPSFEVFKKVSHWFDAIKLMELKAHDFVPWIVILLILIYGKLTHA